jgi:hypothetical protein
MHQVNNPGILPPTTKRVFRWSAPLLLLLCLSGIAVGGENPANGVAPANQAAPAIAIGFVGGFVHPDDMRHAEVQLARQIGALYGSRIHSEIFDNHHQREAYLAIRRWLDTDEDGDLSDAERRASRIILYGHSWGAAAVLSLARELQQEQIPVLLTIQVDRIHKIGENDGVVPANVVNAVNFYQTRGLLHGRPDIAADPSRTQILGEFRLDYARMPAECRNYPWLDRHVFKGHTSIECDPQVWSHVLDFIEAALSAGLPAAVNSRMESSTQAAQPEAAGSSNPVQPLSPAQSMQR